MTTITYSEWHTLTVEADGEEDGQPVMDYTLTHPDSCALLDHAEFNTGYDCWTARLLGEFRGDPGCIGLPAAPGTYRLRAWGKSGDWAGPNYIEPEEGVEVDAIAPGVLIDGEAKHA